MSISIISVNYNNKYGLFKTIESVLHVKFYKFEHLIIDACSSDFNKDDLNSLKNLNISFVSEKDNGVYDGMNKGAFLSKMDYLFFLNSGDILFNPTVINLVKPFIGKYDFIFGDIIVKEHGKSIIHRYPDKLSIEYMIAYGLPHQGTFISRNLHNSVGGYSTGYKIISDWVFFMESIFIKKATYIHIDSVISVFDGHGMSQKEENLSLIIFEQIDYISKRFPKYLHYYKVNSPQVKKYFRKLPRWKRYFKKFLFFSFNRL